MDLSTQVSIQVSSSKILLTIPSSKFMCPVCLLSNLRLQEWVTALFFLEAWLREIPFGRQNDDAKKAAAQALQQEAEELIVTCLTW